MFPRIPLGNTLTLMRKHMSFLHLLPGPHDIPFAAPLWMGIVVGLPIGLLALKMLDFFIAQPEQGKDE
jgi:hypothetical protein